MVNGKPGPAKGTKKPVRPKDAPIELWMEYLRLPRPRPSYDYWRGAVLTGPKTARPAVGHTARPAPTPPDLAARIVPAPAAASYAVPLDDLDRWETELGDGLQGVNPEVLQLRAELRYLHAENARKDRHGRNLLLVLAGAAMLAILSWAFGLF